MSSNALARIPLSGDVALAEPDIGPVGPGPTLWDASVGLPDGHNLPGAECVQRIVGVAVDGDYG